MEFLTPLLAAIFKILFESFTGWAATPRTLKDTKTDPQTVLAWRAYINYRVTPDGLPNVNRGN